MRFTEVICFAVILAMFSSLFSSQIYQLIEKNKKLCELRNETDSLNFISKSFCNSCAGKGFNSLDEWKFVCGTMWQLDSIEWTCVRNGNCDLFYGKWAGPHGEGEVYAKK